MIRKIHIAVDVDGGEVDAKTILSACRKLLTKNANLSLSLCGDASQIKPVVDNWSSFCGRINVVHAEESVGMGMSPVHALRKIKSSSMHHCVQLHKKGLVDAIVSAGNTGALVALSTIHLGMYPSVRRPSICTQIPSATDPFLMLDLGACVDAKPDDVVISSLLAKQLARSLGYQGYTTALLNVGHESVKGNQMVRDVNQLLKPHEHYVGFIEPNKIFDRPCDIVLTDGFTGNLVLKSMEGTMKFAISYLKRALRESWLVWLMWPLMPLFFFALRGSFEKVHPDSFNGAVLLGVRGVVVKSHGQTSEKGFFNALSESVRLVANNHVTETAQLLHNEELAETVS